MSVEIPAATSDYVPRADKLGSDNYLRIMNVRKEFDGFVAVDAVNLSIRKGEIFALLGGSGCGKSTLLRCLAGFETPTTGKIELDGQIINGLQPYNRPINMMFQSYALFPHMTVEQNIAFGLKQDGLPKEAVAHRVDEMLTLVRMNKFAQRKPHQLSGGQQQRVAIARALVNEPVMILADEATGNLDTKTSYEIMSLLQELNSSQGKTIVFVTHEPDIAAFSSRTVTLKDGRVVKDIKNENVRSAKEALAALPAEKDDEKPSADKQEKEVVK